MNNGHQIDDDQSAMLQAIGEVMNERLGALGSELRQRIAAVRPGATQLTLPAPTLNFDAGPVAAAIVRMGEAVEAVGELLSQLVQVLADRPPRPTALRLEVMPNGDKRIVAED